MKIKFQSLIAAMFFFAVIMMASCKKEASTQAPEVNDEEAQTISTENAEAESEYDDVTEIGMSVGADLETAAEQNNGEIPMQAAGTTSVVTVKLDFFVNLYYKVGPCTKITVDPNDGTFPKTVTIDYGDGCLCRDGKFRKGAIVLYFSAPIRRPGAELKITFRDFYVNRVHIEGVKTISNLSASGALKFSVQVADGKLTWPNGRGFTFNGLKVITQTEGMDTRIIRDDVFSIEGRSKTEYANGTVVTKNTETALIKPVACPFIVSGKVKIKINAREFFIDFGTGECDNKALLIWANGEVEIRL
jgi:hypothetical protein